MFLQANLFRGIIVLSYQVKSVYDKLKYMLSIALLSSCSSALFAAEEAESASTELPSFVSVFLDLKINGEMIRSTPFGHTIEAWSAQIVLIFITIVSIIFMLRVSRKLVVKQVPGKLQIAMEMLCSSIKGFLFGLLGEHNKKHIPIFATFLMFIMICNMSGIIPFLCAPTAKYATTVTLAIFIMIYYHYFSFELGWKHVLMHLLNNPSNLIMWILSPLFFCINSIEIFTRPLSLSLRLYGNMMGKDMLLGIFMIIGIQVTAAMIPGTIIGIPLHFPFLFLGLLLGVIQALVFTILSAIYLSLWTTHEEEEPTDSQEQKQQVEAQQAVS